MIRNIITAISILFSLTTFAQVLPDSIHRKVVKYTQNFPQEKIYLHLDRSHYAPGDTIWFKAYILEAFNHLPDSVSKNIYVDFVKKSNGRQVHKLMLKNMGGFSYANISLKDTLSEGIYEIRAFTNWMRNFSEAQFFQKEVYIRKRFEIKDDLKPDQLSLNQLADLQFFPEGGNLISGLQNRVGFKGVNKFGKGVDFAAFIISEHNDTVATIKSKHLGMGSFIFTPKAGEKYFAKIDKSTRGSSPLQKQFFLPVSIKGYSFFVDNLSNKEEIRVIARNNFSTKDRPTLIGHYRGNVVFSLQSVAEGNSFSWNLQKVDIPDDGIVHLTLFNREGIPQCERVIYNDTKSPLAITVRLDKSEYQPHEKVTVSVNVKDFEGKPVQGNFSMSATDNYQVHFEKNDKNIYNYLYLTSDVQTLSSSEVRGEIEQPNYYFDRSNLNAPVDLDILLMTQGWRRFLWSEVLSQDQKTSQTYDIETGITIRGTAKMMSGKKLKEPLSMTMMYDREKGKKSFAAAKTDLEGKFKFPGIEVKEPTQALIQAAKDNGSKGTQISVEDFKWPVYNAGHESVDPFYSDTVQMKLFIERQDHLAELEGLTRKDKVKLLKEIVVTAKTEFKSDSRKTLYEGTNVTSVPVTKQSCASAVHILQLLQGRVAGLLVSEDGRGGYSAAVRGRTSLTGGAPKPVYLVDGIVTDPMFLNGITPCMVESIEVITHPVPIYNAPGLVSILTQRGSPNYDGSQEDARGTTMVKIDGYHIPKEFYSPKYASIETGSQKADFRATLYWNPMIKTDAEGNAKLVFWNSDEKTSINISIEGISLDGQPACGVAEYKVGKN